MAQRWGWMALLVIGVAMLGGCSGKPSAPDDSAKLQVVATTTIVGDVVKQVGGDAIALTVLLPVGADPHAFDPSPQDMAKITTADVIFANGAGLEAFLDPLLENAGDGAEVIDLSEGLDVHLHGGDHADIDPHIWTDPNNVLRWVDVIEGVLTRRSGENTATFAANADAYRTQLRELDAWVRVQVSLIPAENRKLVTDHATFAYFAERYGFEQVGAVVPGYSTASQPSAQALADLEDSIRAYGVKTIFVGKTVNPDLAQRVAEDTGIALVYLYTGSLTESGGEADSYLSYVRYNVAAIVDGLK